MASTVEAAYYGVPMVALPRMLEQAMTARRIAELGVGVEFDPSTVTADQLRAAVSTVIDDPSIAQRVQELRQRTRAAGGYLRAADAIAEFAPGSARRRAKKPTRLSARRSGCCRGSRWFAPGATIPSTRGSHSSRRW
jgi:UDP:flavonoid glycosyltransferase YjiC (YdhE family)